MVKHELEAVILNRIKRSLWHCRSKRKKGLIRDNSDDEVTAEEKPEWDKQQKFWLIMRAKPEMREKVFQFSVKLFFSVFNLNANDMQRDPEIEKGLSL